MTSRKTITLTDGREVPRVAVDALDKLELQWPGATLHQARPAIVAAVLDALSPVREIPLCPGNCDCSCCYGHDDCYHVSKPCNCGRTHDENRYIGNELRDGQYEARDFGASGIAGQ